MLKKSSGLPPNGRRVEKLGSPEHHPPLGYHHRSHPTRFGSDAGRGPNRVHHKPSRCRQIVSRGCPFSRTVRRAYPFPSYLILERALITSTSATLFTEISGGYAIILDRFTTAILTPNQSNILVDTTGCVLITDCGLAMVTQNLDSIRNAPDGHGHSTRWIAPEILANQGTFSKEADVFSFAMVMIEVCRRFRIDSRRTSFIRKKVFTGTIPFNDKSPRAAMLATVGGERPPRPIHSTFTDALWTMTRECWDQEACRRPQVLQIMCSL